MKKLAQKGVIKIRKEDREFQKRFAFRRFLLIFFLLVCFSLTFVDVQVFASSNQYVIPGGDAIGFKLETGVYVAGKYEVSTKDGKKAPWKKCDIQDGDKITHADNNYITTNQMLINAINNSSDNTLDLKIERNNETIKTAIDIIVSQSGEKSIGIYVKDQLLGIGTLTFIDSTTGYFGSLGHGIYDEKVIIGPLSGRILESRVTSIVRGEIGNPGEKRAVLSKTILGNIYTNTAVGVFGKVTNYQMLKKSEMLEVAEQSEVCVGAATIRTVVSGNKIEDYNIEIIEVNRQSTKNIKGLKIKVIDSRLISETGGIIQGMSGSPIIQNNRIVGAVSHVTIDNPLIGYGMHIEWMLKEVTQFDT